MHKISSSPDIHTLPGTRALYRLNIKQGHENGLTKTWVVEDLVNRFAGANQFKKGDAHASLAIFLFSLSYQPQ